MWKIAHEAARIWQINVGLNIVEIEADQTGLLDQICLQLTLYFNYCYYLCQGGYVLFYKYEIYLLNQY